MNEWLNKGIHQVNAILSANEDYQNLLHQLQMAQVDYHNATWFLSQSQREQIENYIALCEEVEYQKTLVVYHCGKQNRS